MMDVNCKKHDGLDQGFLDQGLLSGAVILTVDGEMPVEYLSVGDQLITRDAGVSEVRHITSCTRAVRAIAFAKGCLGPGRPVLRTSVAADQLILLRGTQVPRRLQTERALITARSMIGARGVTDLGLQYRSLFQIFCTHPHIIYCDGFELSTGDGSNARGIGRHAA